MALFLSWVCFSYVTSAEAAVHVEVPSSSAASAAARCCRT